MMRQWTRSWTDARLRRARASKADADEQTRLIAADRVEPIVHSEQELAAARRTFDAEPGVQGLRERFGATVRRCWSGKTAGSMLS